MKKLFMMIGLLFVLSVNKPQMQVARAEEPQVSETAEESTLTVEELPEWVKVVFSPALITALISVFGLIGTVVKLASDLKKIKSIQALSNKELLKGVESLVVPLVDKTLRENAARVGQENVKHFDQYKSQTDKLLKVFALSQENTPESRVAILQLLAGDVDEKVIEKAKETIEVQEQEKVDKKEELNKIVDEVLGEDDLINKL